MLRAILLAVGLLLGTGGPLAADPLADIRAGNQAFADGKIEQAVVAFSRAIDGGGLDPDSLALAHNNRGVAYSELGDFDRAIADYERALQLRPGDPKSVRNLRIAHTRRGLAAARVGELDRALADLTRAIELEPEHPTAYVRRAELRLERGEVEAAIGDLETAGRLAPDNREARAQLDRARSLLAARSTAAAKAEPAASPTTTRTAAAPAATQPISRPTAEPSSDALASGAAGVERAGERAADSTQRVPAENASGLRFRVNADVFVRSEPSTASAAIGSLRRGAEFTARGEEKGWFKVELADGRNGWVYRRFLEPVEPSAR